MTPFLLGTVVVALCAGVAALFFMVSDLQQKAARYRDAHRELLAWVNGVNSDLEKLEARTRSLAANDPLHRPGRD